MGIKTRFNPMGGQNEKGNLSQWRYSTAGNGQITLYEYLGTYSSVKPLYVPKKGGRTVINDWLSAASSGTTDANRQTPFYNNPNVISVDLQNVPFVNNNMSNTFYSCQNLTSVVGINQNVTNMDNTFFACYSLNQNIQIPNSVTNMVGTFDSCSKLSQNIQIPNSVIDMGSTFEYCYNLNQNIQIPNSVTNMDNTFFACYSLNQNIQIGNSVTNMYRTFFACYSLNQNIQIPNSVTDMYQTFSSCYSLNQNIQIPNSVKDMYQTFYYCNNLQGTITIWSPFIASTSNCFNGSGLTKNVIFPSRYIDNTYTITRNSLVSAGYAVGTAVGNLVNNTTQNAVFRAYDPIAWEGYNAWVGDGANWVLTKWGGIGNATGKVDIQVPTSITSYDTFPTAINDTCFYEANSLNSVDCNYVPILPKASKGDNHFFAHTSIKSVCNFNCQGATQLYGITYNSRDMSSFSTGTPQNGTFFIDMPAEVTNAQAMCGHTKNFYNYYLLSDSTNSGITSLKMYSCFNGCNAQSYNIYFTHTIWANGTNMTRNWSNSYRKNIYFYFTYANGVATNIYNAINVANWRGTSGGGLDMHPMYNSTLNRYVYNMSKDYCPTSNPSWWCCPVNGALRYTGVGYADGTPITFPTSLSVRKFPDSFVTVTTNTQDMSNMFNGFFKINTPITIPDGVTSMFSTFRYCTNFNQNIQIGNNVTNMFGTFSHCYNLNQNIQIPDSVIDMYQTFYDCYNLNQNIQIGNNVTNMFGTFSFCNNLTGTINILSENITNTRQSFFGTSQAKDVYIPYNYMGTTERTQTFNSFVTAGYLYANGVSNNQDGVTIHDLNA